MPKIRIDIELTDNQLIHLRGHVGKRIEPRKSWTINEDKIMVRRYLLKKLIEHLGQRLPSDVYDAEATLRQLDLYYY